MVALRSLAEEMAGFRRFRNSLVAGLAGRDGAGLGARLRGGLAHHRPGAARWSSLVERARDGSYSGTVAVDSSDEIGVLARTFNSLLADLREKEQMIGFLREGMTHA